ncbi:MAG: ATP-binding protein [Gammaproteobacteria bacterium]|nr:ATP-binding protein [Gammaproteobacteria bacterium]
MRFRLNGSYAVTAELGKVLDALAARAEALSLPAPLIAKLNLVVEELFLNTMHHGEFDTPFREVEISLERLAASVRLTYEDSGQPYDPFAGVDRRVLTESSAGRRVGGLGVLLVEGLADTACYERLPHRNRIELTFALTP